MPEVPVEAVSGREVQQPVHLLVDLAGQFLPVVTALVKAPADLGKTVKDALFSDPSVNDQFGCQSVHIPPLLSDNMVHYTFLEIALQ